MQNRFVIHEHHARNLHFDLRLEIDDVLKSWAIPKGPSLDPEDKRLAIAVPDHPLSYINYEGTLSEGSYGAGDVRIWDSGRFETGSDPLQELEDGKIILEFFGQKLKGEFRLVKMTYMQKSWLLIKTEDEFASPFWKLKTILPYKKVRMKK